MDLEQLLFDISEALRVPVLVLTVLALAVIVVEFGALVVELLQRRGRSRRRLESTVDQVIAALRGGDVGGAQAVAALAGSNGATRDALKAIVGEAGSPNAETNVAKELADYDYRNLRRLERSRIMVRMGPALGLMGTLIPLSPALAGLASGDVDTLTENLRVAFSVTVAGLMVGAFAFGISLVRDRLYGQDFTDVEFIATRLMPVLQDPGWGAPPQSVQPQPVQGAQPAPPAHEIPHAAHHAPAPPPDATGTVMR